MADLASQLEAAAFRLRRAGRDDLARELTAAMRRGVAPVPGQIRDGLRSHMPDRYAGTFAADVDIKVIARAGSATTDAAVSVYAKAAGKARKLKRLDEGKITHPQFGNREHWYTQEGGAGTGPGMHSGWFTGPCQDAEPRVRAELEKALADVAAKAAG